ncbi:MAG: hypothetical protein JSS23_09185 [Proteobacteria bacterium]|uniref:Cro/CI family transcriptional regulator n=1 Tax=Thermomonas sp. TaxID=1971895 RepID=UPI001DF3078B|nr:Cro/CI family transcriptional regulator [Thermomonas sp.]MBS0228853.1 hypothetical protein [Pseudomonadota bacterium]MBZ0086482.1 Cro/Cl family transcriptional regulator [Thermomonas sp.]
MKTLTTAELRAFLGEKATDADIARLFDITTAAVSQWRGVVPEKRLLQLQLWHPEWFRRAA